jgi:uncharacterized Tic20 family protein
MTGHSGEPTPGGPGFPPAGSPATGDPQHDQAPADLHHEQAPAGQPGGDKPPENPERGAAARPAYGQAGAERDQLWSMLSYLGFFLLVPPLVISVAGRRRSPFVHYHATQALNLCITAFGYTLSCLIVGVLLALDTTGAGLAVGVSLACLVWASAVAFAIVGGVSASRGGRRRLPAWACSPIVK